MEAKQILKEGEFADKRRLFNLVTLKPGTAIGKQRHNNDFEVCHILSRHATYDDNGLPWKCAPATSPADPTSNSTPASTRAPKTNSSGPTTTALDGSPFFPMATGQRERRGASFLRLPAREASGLAAFHQDEREQDPARKPRSMSLFQARGLISSRLMKRTRTRPLWKPCRVRLSKAMGPVLLRLAKTQDNMTPRKSGPGCSFSEQRVRLHRASRKCGHTRPVLACRETCVFLDSRVGYLRAW